MYPRGTSLTIGSAAAARNDWSSPKACGVVATAERLLSGIYVWAFNSRRLSADTQQPWSTHRAARSHVIFHACAAQVVAKSICVTDARTRDGVEDVW